MNIFSIERILRPLKNALVILIGILISFYSFGQAPDWQVDENKFEFTMSLQAFLNVDGRTLSNEQDQLAAFVGEECRGVVNLNYVESTDRHLAYLVLFSNMQGEEISFKIYDSENETIIEPEVKVSFEIDGHYGNAFQAFSVAKPALNNEAEIIDINLSGISTIRKEIVGNDISFIVEKEANLEAINATFEISAGAQLYLETEVLAQGENAIDFREPRILQVLSEDQSVFAEWEVSVALSDGELLFYKKDAVCYAGGAIKIIYPENGEQLVLTQAGSIVATETVSNGEVLITDLPAGNYKVSVGAVTKEIIIGLKEI